MYAPAPFRIEEASEIAALMRAHPFAHLVVNGAAGPVVAYLPLFAECDASGRVTTLVGHVARANPFWKPAEAAGHALAIFAGPHAYVSAGLYPSKAEHGKVVPTWNYLAVEARGPIAVETDPAHLRPYVEHLTDVMEQGRAAPWRVSDAPEAYITSMLRGIVGLRLSIVELEAKAKLSQNKTTPDFEAVRSALAASDVEGDRAVAAAMTTRDRAQS